MLVASALIGLVSCKTETTPEHAETRNPKPVCVVLSVGAEDGLAHIGVLEALKSQGIQPQCIFGNSMGALIGGLYAAHPEHDLKESYRSLMTAYIEQTRADKDAAGLLAFFLLISAGLPPVESTIGSMGVASAVYERDLRRFVSVLDQQLERASIQLLPVQFATWHQTLQQRPTTVTVTTGKLADAIGHSAANPIIFSDVDVRPGARFDPGADRVSAVPLDDACRLRPDAHLIVSNVTGNPIYVSDSMKCSYQEIRINPPKIDARSAFLGVGPEFDRIVSAGYAAANDALGSKTQSGRVPGRTR